jgi:nitroimidazol reductase NimA-like FMN-containing flavoprotein (pyridoxamine 5'-phosphate oxidase superfamily)
MQTSRAVATLVGKPVSRKGWTMFAEEMSHHECGSLVATSHFARLACCKGNNPMSSRFTMPWLDAVSTASRCRANGVEWMRANPKVCVLVEEPMCRQVWRSVVIDSRLQELTSDGQWHYGYLPAWSLLEKHPNRWEPRGLNRRRPRSRPATSNYSAASILLP